tara:strand:- start:18 stop:1475 length:1458 start_codon:yes stop_codon:yes gene_type:complete
MVGEKLTMSYSSLSKEVKASLWFMIASFFQKGMVALTTPIFTRIMSPDQYGKFMVYMSWYEIVFLFATLNFAAGVYNNAMIKFDGDRSGYTSSIQTLSFLCTLIVFVIYWSFSDFFNRTTGLDTNLFTLLFLQILFMPSILFWSARERFERRYIALVVVTIAMSLLNPVLGILTVINTDSKIVARILGVVVVQVGFGLVFTIIQYGKGRSLMNLKYWKYALGLGIPLLPHYLSMVVLNNTDRIIIEHFEGEDKAAIYSVAYSAAMMMMVAVTSINATFVPWTYTKLKEKAYSEIGKYANVLLMLVGALCLLLIAFGPEIIMILAPKEYYEAIWVLPPVGLGAFFIFQYSLYANIEFYFERKYFVLVASLSVAIISVGLNWLLIPVYGYLTAGYVTLFTYLLFSVMHYIFMRITLNKEIIRNNIYNLRLIIILSLAILVFSMIFMYMYEFALIRFVIACALFLFLYIKRDSIKEIYSGMKDKTSLS